MEKIWFMLIMIYVASTSISTAWGMIMKEKTGSDKLLVTCVSVITIGLTYAPILYWSYMWLWESGG